MDARDSNRRYPSLSSQPWRVFLSHTSDLSDYPADRSFVAAAQAAVIRAGHAITNMAYFTARDNEPADYCERMVAQASIYVGIIGTQYGTPVRGRPDRSYTELEYEVATRRRIPRLVFMTRDGARVPVLPQPATHSALQGEFRDRLLNESNVTVAWISNPAELEIVLYQALVELQRGSVAPTPPNRLAQLRRERFLTQEEVAERIGVSDTAYKNWEEGRSRPRPSNMRALTQFFEASEQELGFGLPSEPDTAAGADQPDVQPAAAPLEPLRAVVELVEWLAAASDRPVHELDRLVRSQVQQLRTASRVA